jgi:hypothetical protein
MLFRGFRNRVFSHRLLGHSFTSSKRLFWRCLCIGSFDRLLYSSRCLFSSRSRFSSGCLFNNGLLLDSRLFSDSRWFFSGRGLCNRLFLNGGVLFDSRRFFSGRRFFYQSSLDWGFFGLLLGDRFLNRFWSRGFGRFCGSSVVA